MVAEPAAHRRRNGFATWLFQPAVSGWYPKKAPQEPRPVPVLGDPQPGIPIRGRNSQGRADSCWLPISKGLTPHGLRHTHRTVMEDLGSGRHRWTPAEPYLRSPRYRFSTDCSGLVAKGQEQRRSPVAHHVTRGLLHTHLPHSSIGVSPPAASAGWARVSSRSSSIVA